MHAIIQTIKDTPIANLIPVGQGSFRGESKISGSTIKFGVRLKPNGTVVLEHLAAFPVRQIAAA